MATAMTATVTNTTPSTITTGIHKVVSHSFQKVIYAIGLEIYYFLHPRDLFHLSLLNRRIHDEISKHLIRVCLKQLPSSHLPTEEDYNRTNRSDHIIRFHRRHSFQNAEELVDHLMDKIRISELRLVEDTRHNNFLFDPPPRELESFEDSLVKAREVLLFGSNFGNSHGGSSGFGCVNGMNDGDLRDNRNSGVLVRMTSLVKGRKVSLCGRTGVSGDGGSGGCGGCVSSCNGTNGIGNVNTGNERDAVVQTCVMRNKGGAKFYSHNPSLPAHQQTEFTYVGFHYAKEDKKIAISRSNDILSRMEAMENEILNPSITLATEFTVLCREYLRTNAGDVSDENLLVATPVDPEVEIVSKKTDAPTDTAADVANNETDTTTAVESLKLAPLAKAWINYLLSQKHVNVGTWFWSCRHRNLDFQGVEGKGIMISSSPNTRWALKDGDGVMDEEAGKDGEGGINEEYLEEMEMSWVRLTASRV